MCGICGIVNLDKDNPVDIGLLNRMCESIIHRGPDDQGQYVKGNIGLGIRRLSIIDLVTGHQPVHNEDKTVWVIFNGEIYNFPELREKLLGKGHSFYTQTDTETIVHLYEEYDLGFVNHLRGMFGLAIWDEKKKRLVLARDRIGIKQLYYARTRDRFLFGSEIKCILQDKSFEKKLNLSSVNDYFTFSYTIAPETLFQGIYKLLPGHILILENNVPKIHQYWRLTFQPDYYKKEDEYVEELLDILGDSVKSHLISDVPLGVFLSGGIDSSMVVGTMKKFVNQPIQTFSIGFGENESQFDERPFARIVSKNFYTDHHEKVITPDIQSTISAIVRAFDEPFGDSSAIPTYFICKYTKEYVKVALSGLGGDEICSGYERYLGVLLGNLFSHLPNFLTQLMNHIVLKLPDSSKGSLHIERMKRFINGVNSHPSETYMNFLALFRRNEREKIFSDEFSKKLDLELPERRAASYFGSNGTKKDSIVNNMLSVDFNTWLPDNLLTLTDRMSMAHSLEVRVPLLDNRLVDFFSKVPPNLKIKNLNKKYLLKKAGQKMLPSSIIRRKKQGFSIPLPIWLRSQLKDYVYELLSTKNIKTIGLFKPTEINFLIDSHMKNKRNFEKQLFAMMTFFIWYDAYFNN